MPWILLIIIIGIVLWRFRAPKPMVIEDNERDILGEDTSKEPIPGWDEKDVEALSRMVASENPTTPRFTATQNRDIQTAIIWTAINAAKRRGSSVAELVMPGGNPSGQNTGGRYASTAKPGNDEYRLLARQILSGFVGDPTGGAIQFDSPRSQRAALGRNVAGYSKTPEQVAASRRSEGKIQVNLPGIDPDYMRWWRYA